MASDAAVLTEESAVPAVPFGDWTERRKVFLFAIMAFGQFMALLDIQIVAASLNSIQAGLNAGPDEIAWVQTAYLMAEIVMIPLAAFLSTALSTRWLFAGSAILFTLSSLACGFAWNIESMIVFRAIQGFVGGAMIPTVFATGFALFQGPRQAMVPAVLGVVSTLAPTLGPSVGGWITEIASWRWVFLMNVAPGLLIAFLIPRLAKGVDEAQPAMLRRIDWLQLTGLALFLGALQYMLEEGPRHGWLEDRTVMAAGLVSLVGAGVFFERCFYSATPIVRLTPFRTPTFALACALNAITGFGLYSATYLLPVYLGRVRGYTSLDIGTTVFVTGGFMLLGAPIAARLSTKVDQRYVIATGFTLFATGLWLTGHLTSAWGFNELFFPQAVRGFAILLCIVPAVGLALNAPPPSEIRWTSGLFNLMRNLGGAVGIAVVNTMLTDLTRTHTLRLSEALGAGGETAAQVQAGLAARAAQWTPDPELARLSADAILTRIVQREALTLAFNDVFFFMACVFLAGLIIVPFARPVLRPGALPPDAH